MNNQPFEGIMVLLLIDGRTAMRRWRMVPDPISEELPRVCSVAINVTAVEQIYFQVWRFSQAWDLMPSFSLRTFTLWPWSIVFGLESLFVRNERNLDQVYGPNGP